MRALHHCILSSIVLVLLAATAAAGAPAADGFARILRDAGGAPLAFQTAIVSYVPADGDGDYTVDLIGAVHVADAAYYAALNERFAGYDALLYEMVVPEEGAPEPGDAGAGGAGGLGIISRVQMGLRDMLGLSFQLEEIDYGAPNFVHADLSTRTLKESMRERNESLYVYFWRIVFASMDQYAKDPLGLRDWEIMAAMVRGGDALRLAVAEEMLASIASGDVFGDENGSAIIAARNEHAVGVLRRQIDAGTRRIGIFYGVAHMPDFERRLAELGLERAGVEWVDAWRFGAGDN
jgi:hypothetical protein